MAEKGITGGICHYFSRYKEDNNKYIKDCDPGKIFFYLMS